MDDNTKPNFKLVGTTDTEIEAIRSVSQILDRLDHNTQCRVVRWAKDRYLDGPVAESMLELLQALDKKEGPKRSFR